MAKKLALGCGLFDWSLKSACGDVRMAILTFGRPKLCRLWYRVWYDLLLSPKRIKGQIRILKVGEKYFLLLVHCSAQNAVSSVQTAITLVGTSASRFFTFDAERDPHFILLTIRLN